MCQSQHCASSKVPNEIRDAIANLKQWRKSVYTLSRRRNLPPHVTELLRIAESHYTFAITRAQATLDACEGRF